MDQDVRLLMELVGEVKALREDVAEVKADVKETKAEVKLTNGRVKALEMWRERIRGGTEATSWIRTILVSVTASAASAGVIAAAVYAIK